jgi:hypothetical protein
MGYPLDRTLVLWDFPSTNSYYTIVNKKRYANVPYRIYVPIIHIHVLGQSDFIV